MLRFANVKLVLFGCLKFVTRERRKSVRHSFGMGSFLKYRRARSAKRSENVTILLEKEANKKDKKRSVVEIVLCLILLREW